MNFTLNIRLLLVIRCYILHVSVTSEEIPIDELKSKKSELRLYCDLLMQQVYSVKSAVQETPVPNVEVGLCIGVHI